MYVESILEDNHLKIFTDVLKKASEIHNYITRLSLLNSVKISEPKTEKQKPMADTPLNTNVPPHGTTY